ASADHRLGVCLRQHGPVSLPVPRPLVRNSGPFGSSRSAAPSRKRMRARSPGTATRAGREVAGESEVGGGVFLAIARAGHGVPCHPSRAAAPIAGGSGAGIGAGLVRVCRSWRGAPDRDDLGTAMVSDGGRVVMLLSVLLLSVLSADVRKPPKNQP